MNPTYKISMRAPFQRVMVCCVYNKGNINMVTPSKISDKSRVAAACRFKNIPAKPKISKILNTLDPRTLPTAISDSFFHEAIIDTTSSGNEVPTATKVNAITSGSIPKIVAKRT